VLRAAGETETTQESIQDWLQLDEGDPAFQLLTEEEIAAVIFFLINLFHQHYLYYYNLHVLVFQVFFCLQGYHLLH
jgi:hypothetical protein